ncbi:Dihydrolipoyllysine-residue acetyltransferase component of pyruvate dehydrogenase complex [compost metagenome]
MSGGCITISSLGSIGGTAFTPIVNAPEVAILGITSEVERLYLEAGEVRSRRLLPLSLSYDHRVINGADAARFCRFLADQLASPGQLNQATGRST